MTLQITELPALWQEAEQHIRAFEKLARRTVEEAWLAGDALLRIKQKLPHGAWTPALQERGIHPRQARRFIQLRQKYPQIGQIVRFDSVSAALTRAQPRRPLPIRTPYLISVDDLWDWQRWEPTPLAHRFLDAIDLEQFSTAIVDAVRQYLEVCETREELLEFLKWFRLALSCQVDFGPLESDPDAIAETARREAAYGADRFDWIENLADFQRLSAHHLARLPMIEKG